MLLYFQVGGFCSFNQKQALYLTPAANTRLKGTQYEVNFAFLPKEKVMKSVVLFGANASGKTNLLLAMKKLHRIISEGLRLPDQFEIEEKNHQTDTLSFAIELIDEQNDIYYYELAYTQSEIVFEKLSVNDRSVYTYEQQQISSETKEIKPEIIAFLSKRATEPIIQKLRDEQLPSVEVFKRLIAKFHFETHSLLNIGSKEVNLHLNEEGKQRLEQQKSQVLTLMKFIDCRICDFHFEQYAFENKQTMYQIYFEREHSTAKFYLGNESEGVKKMMYLMKQLLRIQMGEIVVIDALDSQISTNTLLEIFNDFIHTAKNTTGQLIVTSHNLLLLDQQIFQKQQMYIVNKGNDLSSEVYSLAEFDLRTEHTQLYKPYMKGKFGGVNG